MLSICPARKPLGGTRPQTESLLYVIYVFKTVNGITRATASVVRNQHSKATFNAVLSAYLALTQFCRRPPVLLPGYSSSLCASLWCLLMYGSRISQRPTLYNLSEVFSDGKTILKSHKGGTLKHTDGWKKDIFFRPLLTIWLWPVVDVDIQLFWKGNEFYHSLHVFLSMKHVKSTVGEK